MSNEKFCLRWNDFESNISMAFRELRDDKDFFDVTLVCEDEQIQSHKMILSACSPFFRNILRRNPHQHPLLYLKGVKYGDLQCVLNFMYHGEVNVAQEELNSFLAVAEDLQVKGLTQNQSNSHSQQLKTSRPKSPPVMKSQLQQRPPAPAIRNIHPPPQSRPQPLTNVPTVSNPTSKFSSASHNMDADIEEVVPVKTEPRDTAPTTPNMLQPAATQDLYTTPSNQSLAPVEEDSYGYQDDQYAEYEQYDEGQDYGMVDQTYAPADVNNKGQAFQDPSELLQYVRKDPEDKKFYCTLCERFSHKAGSMTRNHVESQHFPNTFSYPCDICGEVLTTKSNLWLHRSRKHLNKKHQL